MAAPHGVTVPKDNSDAALLGTLKGLKGKAFDQAYISKVGVEGHKGAVAAFQKELADGQDAKLKKAAQDALPNPEALSDGAGSRRQKGRIAVVQSRLSQQARGRGHRNRRASPPSPSCEARSCRAHDRARH